MKRHILSIILLLSFGFAKAQLPEIPNGGFENWENRFLFSKPLVWETNNNPDFAPLTTIRSDDMTEGEYSLRLESILEEREGEEDRVNFGYALISGEGEEEMPAPIEWHNTADMVHFQIKYSIQPGDGGLVWIVLDYAGETVFQHLEFLEGVQTDWLAVSLPLDPLDGNPVDIDGLLIGFTSSAPEGFPGAESFVPKEGSWLMVDNVYFSLDGTSVGNNVPNGGFEDWQDISPFEPVGWTSTNIYAAAYNMANVTRSEDAFPGSYAAKLETLFFDGGDKRGVLSLGDGLWSDGGAAFSGSRPYFIGGAYKYEPGNPFSENPASLSLDLQFLGSQISGAYLEFPATAEYTRFTSTMMGYHTEDNPDYMYLTISSANEAGSVLYIDDIEFLEAREVKFTILDPGGNPADGEIEIAGTDPVIIGDVNPFHTHMGELIMPLPDGNFEYSLNVPGYPEITDQIFTISGSDITITVNLESPFAGGDGTSESPWQIATAQHLDNIREYTGNDHWDKHFILINIINLGEAPWNEGEGWEPIGNNHSGVFRGAFDGDVYTISGLTINRPDEEYVGLFGLTSGGNLNNITLESVNIKGRSRVGGLVGQANHGTIINSCMVTGQLEGELFPAGIAGNLYNNSVIEYSSADVTVTIVPGATNQQAGGIAGRVSFFSRIEKSFSTGNVNGLSFYTGGIAGLVTDNSQITNSYSTGAVAGENNVGGLVGRIENSEIIDCYSTGMVSGNSVLGGLIGSALEANVSASYWNTETSGQQGSAAGEGLTTAQMLDDNNFGGWDFTNTWAIGAGTYPWLVWQGDAGPHNYPPQYPAPVNLQAAAGDQKAGLTWAAPSTGSPDGYKVYRDGTEVADLGSVAFEYEDTGLGNLTEYSYYVTAMYGVEESGPSNTVQTVPRPAFEHGSGEPDDEYEIHNADDLNLVRFFLDAHFKQMADINLGTGSWITGEGWEPIGNLNSLFTGSYDGNGFVISNLYINREEQDYIGLFGYLSGADIRNVLLETVNITGKARVGALSGITRNSTITVSRSSGSITATGNWSGGLVGSSSNSNNISKSFSTVNIESHGSSAGGLVGTNESNSVIVDSYATGSVLGINYTGGLVGWISGGSGIINSYSSGLVHETDNSGGLAGGGDGSQVISSSYWVLENSGHTNSAGGEGKTIAEMVDEGTFADWDLTGIWGIDGGSTFPWLKWESGPSAHNYPPEHPAPFNFHANQYEVSVILNWSEPTAGSTDGYNIYRNYELLVFVEAPAVTYTDTDVSIFDSHTYYVKAVYTGDESVATNSVTIELLPWFSEGDGSEGNPFQVATADDLYNVRYYPWAWFEQVADINLGADPWNSGDGWEPIGDFHNRFTGNYNGFFDGENKKILNLTIDDPQGDFIGLFGYTDGAVIKNLDLVDASVAAQSNTGILAGELRNTEIDNINVTGSVSASWNTGGLAAMLSDGSTLSNSSFNGTANSNNYAGGLLSNTWGSTIENCHVNAEIFGYDNVGGLVGHNNSTIRFSSSEGLVNGNSWLGGLAGYNTGQIEQSYSTAEVQSLGKGAGGLVGWNDGGGSITDSYATGNVSGNESVGGLAGLHDGWQNIERSYSTGHVSGNNMVGGLVGGASGPVNNSYWNTETSGQAESAGGAGYNTEGMTAGSTFDGWDFASPGTWSINEGETYPWLQWQGAPGPHNYPPGLNITNVSPNDEEKNVPVGQIIRVWFDRNIQAGNTGLSLIRLTSDLVDAGIELAITDNLLEITPGENMAYGKQYNVTIPVGSVADAGDIDNTLLSDYIFSFETQYDPAIKFTLTVEIDPPGAGTVETPGMVEGVGEYAQGEEFYLEAIPETGYVFDRWYYFDGSTYQFIDDINPLDVSMPGQDVLLRASFTEEEPEDITITFIDDDTDKVYFPGDDFSIKVSISGAIIPDNMFTPVVTEGVFDQTISFTEEAVLDGATRVVSAIVNNEFTVSGTIQAGVSQGVIGMTFNIAGNETQAIPVIDKSLYNEASGSDFGMAIVGVEIPFGDVTSDPDFSGFDNLYDTEQPIDFVRAGHGTLQFGAGLNIIDNRDELIGLHDGLRLVSDSEVHTYYVEINPASLTFLADREANIEIEGYALSSFTIRKTDFGVGADYEAPEDVKANTTAVLVDNVLTFTVDGFSRYTVLEGRSNLSLEVNNVGWGTAVDQTDEGPYAPGTEVTVLATPVAGYEFYNWRKNGVVVSDQSTFGYIMPAEDVTLVAHFIPEGAVVYTLTLEVEPFGAGTVTGAGEYVEGEEVSLDTEAAAGFVFDRWTDGLGDPVTLTDGKFTMPAANVTLTANFRKILTLDGLTAADKEYNGNVEATVTDWGELEGLLDPGHEVTLVTTGATATFASADAGNDVVVTVSGMALAGIDAHRYVIYEQETTAGILKKELTVTGAEAQDKVYDGTTLATVTGATLDGVIGSDDVSLHDHTTGTFASEDAGVGIAVSTNMTISGTDAGNYTLAQPGGLEADITTASLTVTADDKSMVLAGTDPVFTVTYDEFVAGEDKSVLTGELTFAFDPADTSAPGEYVIIPSGLASENYNISFVNGTLTVYVRLTLLVSPVGAGTVMGAGEAYSEGDEVAISASASAGYEFVGWTDEGGDPVTLTDGKFTMPAANVTLTANFEATDYILTLEAQPAEGGTVTDNTGSDSYTAGDEVSVSASPNTGFEFRNWTVEGTGVSTSEDFLYAMPAAHTTLTANFVKILSIDGLSAADKVYDGTTAATVSDWGALGGLIDAGHNVTLVTTAATATFASKDAGTDIAVTITGLSLTGADAGMYTIKDQQAAASITQKALTVTAGNKSKVLGDPDPAFTATLAGFVTGEDENNLDGTLTFSFDPTDTSSPGSYEIIPSGLSSDNYNISFVNGTFTVYVSLSLLVEPAGAGTVSGAGDNYNEGDQVEIGAEANPGYRFVEWTDEDGDPVTLTNGKFAMPAENVTLTANFESLYIGTFTVERSDETPLEGVEITITQNGDEIEVITTGASGTASVELPAGDYGYAVTAADYEDDSGSFTVTDDDVDITVILLHTGVLDPASLSDRLVVYPNPSDGFITVEYSGAATEMITLEVISVAGNLLYAREFQGADNLKETIDLRHASRGVYFLRIRENGTVKTIQIVFR